MNNNLLFNSVKKNLFWSGLERFSSQIIQFICGIILARILTPTEFGLVAIITVFVSIGSVIVDGGFFTALVQKKQPSQVDYSTPFYLNLITSLFL